MLKRACTKEQITQRKNEIIKVVSEMFDTMDYQEISMKTISERISIARSSLYCYYNTKEEIMLDVLQEDYIKFVNQLILAFKQAKDNNQLADLVSDVYCNNKRLLKIISVHLIDIETHSSLENLVQFKTPFVSLFTELAVEIATYFKKSFDETKWINQALNMLTFSLYPTTNPLQIQKDAMEKVEMPVNLDMKSTCYNYLRFLFKSV